LDTIIGIVIATGGIIIGIAIGGSFGRRFQAFEKPSPSALGLGFFVGGRCNTGVFLLRMKDANVLRLRGWKNGRLLRKREAGSSPSASLRVGWTTRKARAKAEAKAIF
jgi:hypothetical protein